MGGARVVISVELLSKEAEATGFRPDVQEKVILLIELLNAISSDDFLGPRIASKGGTALNLFQFNLPRLSVDIV
jgi:predicted nucleotidyltransferase component of viral defense system